MAETGVKITELNEKLGSANEPEKAALQVQINALTEEKSKLRKSELQAIEWKPLWGKPALFAAGVMVLFLLLFRDGRKKQPFPESGPMAQP